MQNREETIKSLQNKAKDIRKDLVTYCNRIGGCHIGGALSMCDVVVALFYHFMHYNPKDFKWEGRDRFILSKGHTACLLYNIFADMGMFTKEQIYSEYNKIDGRFGQHPNRLYLPMFEASTGSLGHGLPIAVGVALGLRIDKKQNRVFCLTGDAELNEGSNWEALMAASQYKLGNLVLIIDRNRLSSTRPTEEAMALEPLEDKLKSFGWDVWQLAGNDMNDIVDKFSDLPEVLPSVGKPIAFIANTTKGKGISFIENLPKWHTGCIGDDLLADALESIEKEQY